jgi:NodT family efflux transporter outer membrane factor (OMF) lipoprotein
MSDSRRTHSRTRALPAAALLLGLTLAGCMVGPDFKRPVAVGAGGTGYLPEGTSAGAAGNRASGPGAATPAETAAEAAQHVALGEKIPGDWWALFHCGRLDQLLRQAIADNYTLAAAKATLAQAQEAVVAARGTLLPQVSLAATAHRGNGAPGAPSGNLFSVGPSASYLIDAFGGTRRHVEQEAALAENQRFQLAAAYLTLTGSSVTEAIAIASTRLQIATVEDVIKNDEKNLDLTQRELDAGKVARTDVLTAEAQLENDRVQLPPLHQQLSVARHALTALAGKPTGEWSPPDFNIDEFTLPDNIPVSLPSDLVRQRPDILAAEAALHADSAAIGVATANLYPSITLSASLAQEAGALGNLLKSAGRIWGVGAALAAPLYSGGTLQAQQRGAVDAYNAQLALYQQTVLQAFDQVADALSALEHDAELVAVAHRAVDIASSSLNLQRLSYQEGKTSALQLITAEDAYAEARLSYARAVGQRMTDSATLLIAAGGSWWPDAGPTPALDAPQAAAAAPDGPGAAPAAAAPPPPHRR